MIVVTIFKDLFCLVKRPQKFNNPAVKSIDPYNTKNRACYLRPKLFWRCECCARVAGNHYDKNKIANEQHKPQNEDEVANPCWVVAPIFSETCGTLNCRHVFEFIFERVCRAVQLCGDENQSATEGRKRYRHNDVCGQNVHWCCDNKPIPSKKHVSRQLTLPKLYAGHLKSLKSIARHSADNINFVNRQSYWRAFA